VTQDFVSRILSNFNHPPEPCKSIDIAEKDLTRDFFQNEVLPSRIPVLVNGGVPGYARKEWTPEKLKQYLESRDETVWITRGVADQGTSNFEEISIQDFAKYLFNAKPNEEKEPMYVSISKEFMQILPDMVQEFGLDRLLPPLYSKYPYAFLGPQGTVSGLHCDEYHSLFMQVWGDKTFLLFDPSDTPNIYVSEKYDWASRLSMVDLRQIDHNRKHFPAIGKCRPRIARVTDGAFLWIPSTWFHFVYAHASSFSITFFLSAFFQSITYGIWEDRIKVFLHEIGIYGRKNGCTCHGTLVPIQSELRKS
jgi:hypothetical protein